MGLGIVFGSLISAVCDATGDDGQDAIVKVKRLTNQRGPSFCDLGNFPFLRDDISFTIGSSAYKYSGASYLPTTFKRPLSAFILDGSDRHDLDEVSISEAYKWPNPNDNQGIPDQFCVTRVESGYWEIQFNRLPDASYVVYMEIEKQWVDVSSVTEEVLVTKDFFDYLAHWIKISRYEEQGDGDNLAIANNQWNNPMQPGQGMLARLLGKLSSPSRKKRIKFSAERAGVSVGQRHNDYNERL